MKNGLPVTWAKKPSGAADVGASPSPPETLGATLCLILGVSLILASLAIDNGYRTIFPDDYLTLGTPSVDLRFLAGV